MYSAQVAGNVAHGLRPPRGTDAVMLANNVGGGTDNLPGICALRVWDTNVGDWPVGCAGLGCLSVALCQIAVQAALVWVRGCQVSSQRLLACRHRRVRMPVAPCSVHLMPDSLSRWPMSDLQPAST